MSPANQATFVQACVDAVNTYDLDGEHATHTVLDPTDMGHGQVLILTGYVAVPLGITAPTTYLALVGIPR